jgi:hypothetical protein
MEGETLGAPAPTTPPGATGESGAGSSPVDWNSFAQQLPEEYRSNPTDFIKAYHETSKYKDFYHNEYEPWQRTFDAKGYQGYLQARQTGQQGQGQPQATSRQASAFDELDQEIDWEDPTSARTAYDRQKRALLEHRNQQQMHQQQFEQAKQQYIDLLQLMTQAEDLRRSELYDFMKQKFQFQPRINPQAVVQYAMEHGINDLNLARDQLYREDETKRLREESIAEGRRLAEQEYQNRRPTGEQGPGTPPRLRARPAEAQKGYGASGREQLNQMIANKIGRQDLPW